jgi:hypothetical protein
MKPSTETELRRVKAAAEFLYSKRAYLGARQAAAILEYSDRVDRLLNPEDPFPLIEEAKQAINEIAVPYEWAQPAIIK